MVGNVLGRRLRRHFSATGQRRLELGMLVVCAFAALGVTIA